MSLYRQIAISIILLFIASFIGTVAISTNTLRTFLASQLVSHAQDTATSLGLSLSPHMQTADLPIMSSMVDAIFDRGDYSKINVKSMSGEVLIERSNPFVAEEVPDWFVKTVTLQTPQAEALVMSGWRQSGTVEVSSHPGRAYQQLWNNTIDTFKLFLLFASVTLVLGLVAVRVLLRPLRRVEVQADAICNQSYPIQEKLPRTRELKSVVMAMNRMSEKVDSLFSDQSVLTERLREQAYLDPVTGLGNRRYFDRRMQDLLDSRGGTAAGALLLIELRDLKRLNENNGYAEGDRFLKRAAVLLQSRIENADACFSARIAGAGFAAVLAGYDAHDSERLAEGICRRLQQLEADGLAASDDICNIGIAMWHSGDALTDLLARANTALRAAQSSGCNNWQRYQPSAAAQAEALGTARWRSDLLETIETGNISLAVQPVYKLDDSATTILHREIFLRIPKGDGNSINAGIFMPMAEHAGLASKMDKLAVTALLKHMESDSDMDDYAVNLSSASLADPAFIGWLYKKLSESPASTKRLLIEFSEYALHGNMQGARMIIERLGDMGCRCGIDHFGRGFYSFGYLHSLKINHLKIDGSYSRNLDREEDNQFFIQALTDTAHSIDIKVIAQAVETIAERDIMKKLKLDGIQGYLNGLPQRL